MKKGLMIFLFLVVEIFSYSIMIEPLNFGKRISYEDTGYKEYEIYNNSEEKNIYKIEVRGEDGFEIGVYPKVVIMEPNSRKKLKLLIKQKQEKAEGEYKFEMYLSPVKILNTELKENGLVGDIGIVIGLDLIGYIGDLGDATKEVKIRNVEVKKNILSFNVENKMKKSVKLMVVTYKSGEKKEEFKYIKRVPKNSSRKIELPIKKGLDKIKIYDIESEKEIFSKGAVANCNAPFVY